MCAINAINIIVENNTARNEEELFNFIALNCVQYEVQ